MKTQIEIEKIDFIKRSLAEKDEEIEFLEAYVIWDWRFIEKSDFVEIIIDLKEVFIHYRTGNDVIENRYCQITSAPIWSENWTEHKQTISGENIKICTHGVDSMLLKPESIMVEVENNEIKVEVYL